MILTRYSRLALNVVILLAGAEMLHDLVRLTVFRH